MKRQIGTVLSVAGLLAVGVGAAALNAHVLHSTTADPGRMAVRTIDGMTVMNASTGLPLPDATAGTGSSTPPGTGTQPIVVTSSANATGDSTTAIPEGSMMDRMRDGVTTETGTGVRARLRMMASLTVDQRNLLRIAAMSHVPPRLVLAAAKGQPVDPADLATIESVAAYIGVDLASLAHVTSLPQMMERGHGGPNDRGGMNYDN